MDCQIRRCQRCHRAGPRRQSGLVLVVVPLGPDRRGGPRRGARCPGRHGGRLLPQLERNRPADPLPPPVARDRRPVPDRGGLRIRQPRAQAHRRRANPPRRRTDRGDSVAAPTPRARRSSERASSLHVFPRNRDGGPERLERIGDPTRLTDARLRRGRRADLEGGPWGRRPWVWGPSVRASRLAGGGSASSSPSAGVAAYRPSGGPGRPDFEQAAGAFVPRGARALRAGVPGRTGGSGPLRGEGRTRHRLRPPEPDRRRLSRPGRRRRGGPRARRRERGPRRRGAPAVAGRSPRRARPLRPSRGARLALAHPGARAQPEHGAGRRGGIPTAVPGAGAVRPAAHRGDVARTPGPLPRGGCALPAARRRRDRAGGNGRHTFSSPAGSRRSSTCWATRGRSSGPARARSPGGSSGTCP